MSRPRIDFVLTEGQVDAAVALRLLKHFGIDYDGAPQVANGNAEFWERVPAFNGIAASDPVFALADLESLGCVGPILRKRIRQQMPNLMIRLAVPMIEAWLLADADGIASLLGVPRNKVPRCPDDDRHPKRTLVNLARLSNRREIAKGLVPALGTTAQVGPAYTDIISDFVASTWDPTSAASRSRSCERALSRLRAWKAEQR